jgi:drug/metabolite transporter (DMT)-like permease
LAIPLSLLAAFFFGTAVVTGKLALRTIAALHGTAISIPSSLVAVLAVFLYTWDGRAFNAEASKIFAAVGFLYPALVALLRFYATDRIGAAITSSVLATTTPLFALAVAVLLTDEAAPARAFIASCGVVSGIFLITLRPKSQSSGGSVWWLALPFAAAAISGLAQVFTKAGLQLWSEPLAAALISYTVSTVTILTFVFINRPKQAPRSMAPRSLGGASWFAFTGVFNGMGVLSMFAALNSGPVALVAPLVASYPLVTMLLGGVVLADEAISVRKLAGALLACASIAYLISA